MAADPRRVAAVWLEAGFSRGRARVLLNSLDGAGLRWNRDWWGVLENLVSGGSVNSDEYNYAFHAIRNDIKRAEAAQISAERLALLTELKDVFAARTAAKKKWNPWTAPLGEKRPKEPEKGSYEAYVERKKKEGEKPLSKEDWEKAIKRHRYGLPL